MSSRNLRNSEDSPEDEHVTATSARRNVLELELNEAITKILSKNG
jgi:hypothetical protein